MLTSCGLGHKHIHSDWYYNNLEHWKILECNKESCITNNADTLEKHIDNDGNQICDICGYDMTE